MSHKKYLNLLHFIRSTKKTIFDLSKSKVLVKEKITIRRVTT